MMLTNLFSISKKSTILFAFAVMIHCFLRAQDSIPTTIVDSTIQKVDVEKTQSKTLEKTAHLDSSVLNSTTLSKEPTSILNATVQDSTIDKTMIFKSLYGVGLNGGTNGIGLDLYYKFHTHFAVRVGFNYLAYKFENKQFSFTTTASDGTKTVQTIEANLDFNMNNVSALVEYSLGKKGRLRFVTGFAFYPKKSVILDAKLITNFKLNDAEISGEDLGSGGGTLFLKNKISPYFGLGIGRLAPRKRINLSLDLGAYYLGSYDIKDVIINPGLFLEGNKDNAPIIARNLNADWRNKIFPIINVRLGIRLNK